MAQHKREEEKGKNQERGSVTGMTPVPGRDNGQGDMDVASRGSGQDVEQKQKKEEAPPRRRG